MDIKTVLNKNTKKINKLDAEILLAHVLKKSREFLFANSEFEINFLQKIKFNCLVKKRQKNIPIAYLTKHKEFFGLDFFVNKNVLVPRPDTELMVETALEHLNTLSPDHDNILLIDVGTGSGCIPISIMKTLEHKNTCPDLSAIKTFAVDVSRKSLKVAKQNAKKHNVEIQFLHGNLLEPFLNNNLCNQLLNQCNQCFITANLPYITEKQFQNEPSIQKEPKLALIAKNEGLALYEELLKQIKQLLSTFEFQLSTMFEIDPEQTEKIKTMIKKYLPKSNIEVKKDLAGLDRLVIIS